MGASLPHYHGGKRDCSCLHGITSISRLRQAIYTILCFVVGVRQDYDGFFQALECEQLFEYLDLEVPKDEVEYQRKLEKQKS